MIRIVECNSDGVTSLLTCMEEESSTLAFSAASLTLWSAMLSLETSSPCCRGRVAEVCVERESVCVCVREREIIARRKREEGPKRRQAERGG